MLRIVNLEEIERCLLAVPALIDLQERRDPRFDDEVKKWLVKLEKALENNRLAIVGAVAALRGSLISAERGTTPPEVVISGRPSARKKREATAQYLLRSAAEIVTGVIEKDRARVEDAMRLCRQLVAIGVAKNIIQPLLGGADHTGALKAIWRALSADPDIKAGTINVEGIIGPYDVLIVLDRIIASDVNL